LDAAGYSQEKGEFMNLPKITMLSSCLLLSLSATATTLPAPQQQFFDAIKTYCGQAFAGKLVKSNDSDKDMLSKSLIMHVRECSDTELKVPFHVGDDHSRTWVITKTEQGLRLKHDHRHQDGTSDKVTMYGGATATPGTANKQAFPAGQHSKTMFAANQMTASSGNTWFVEIIPGKVYRYGLKREGREFEVEFDLTKPVATPPTPWGHQ
jgi:hypothetical protein